MNAIVFTTIQPPTDSIRHWAELGWQLVGVGDRKTPRDWRLDGCTFIDAASQSGPLSDVLPWNHYCRKMIGYIAAAKMGATTIIDTDDDNDPTATMGIHRFAGEHDVIDRAGFVNVYSCFTDRMIWPRGLPLNLIADRPALDTSRRQIEVGVWQGLADDDPDVDAIYRMTRPQKMKMVFNRRRPVVLGRGSLCPFNSQNTVFRKELFPLLYLPSVSFRFTDILRGLVAQPIMWHAGYHLGFTEATVTQARNPHDYMQDFRSEIPMYLHAADVPQIVAESIRSTDIRDNLFYAYDALRSHEIVDAAEMKRLTAWLNEIG